jgi:hypothetical protein
VGCAKPTDAPGHPRRGPYNAQVALLRDTLPQGARVGTVDKFQGQEAAVVIFSPASSSAEEAPRGMEFLHSPKPTEHGDRAGDHRGESEVVRAFLSFGGSDAVGERVLSVSGDGGGGGE